MAHGLVIAATAAASLAAGACLWRILENPAHAAEVSAGSRSAAAVADAERARHFEEQIAPLLARRCLECHGPKSKKGRLDLSRKGAALAGGENGPAVVAGKPDDSLLWQYVDADEMPKDGPPLTGREKQALRDWIETGAIWTADVIVPAAADPRAGSHRLRRLTVAEYIETVQSAVGVDIEQDARRTLPPDLRADGFSNTAYNLNVDLGHVEAYARLAEIIVSRIDVASFAAQFSQSRELSEEPLRQTIAAIGKWLLRGPLDEHELAAFLGVATAVAKDGGDFDEAIRYVIETMLQSPRFIYRIEKQHGDGTPRRVDDYELASRLSYILWGGPPDRELMRAADAGELSDRGCVEAQVRRMLEDPRAIEKSLQFMREWLNLDHLANLRPSEKRFPDWSKELAADMRDETLAFFKHIVWEQKRPLAELMNARVTFATPRLADHYGFARQAAVLAAEGAGRPAGTSAEPAIERVTAGLQALYRFDERRGETVHDTSGAGEPLHLRIADPQAVHWSEQGLHVHGSTLIVGEDPPKRLIEAVKKSNAVTLEAWVTPANAEQTGPARIVTLSTSVLARNFTLGQDGEKFDVRLRTNKTDGNGLPSRSTPAGTVQTRPTHVVCTRDVTGRVRLYIDGEERAADEVGGDFSNWDGTFRLALANETTNDRPWRGTFHRIAIYTRALTAEEIRARGPGLSRYDLAGIPGRGGLLTQGSVLTVGGDEASMVTRGLFLLHNVLDGTVEDPPPCVDTTPVPTKPGLSQRAVAEARLANQACGGCHGKFEPLAFGLEKFNGLGAWQEADEHGNTLREDGEVLFPGQDQPVKYQSAAQLMDLLAGSDQVRRTITRKVTQFAVGRPLTAADAAVLESIHAAAKEGGGTYASLVTAIVMSDLVQTTGTEAH